MIRIALLANPQSGSGEAGEVVALLAERGAEVSAFEPDQCDAAVAAAPERIVVAGGDGSIAPAAEAASRAAVPLAVVAVGTANDFARALGISRDTKEAVTLAVEGSRTRSLDLGRMDGRPFVNAASAGLSPVAARDARGLKSLLGPLAYAAGALRAGLRAEPVACRVLCDGRRAFAGSAWQVTVASTGAFGGGADIAADPRDGALDAVVIEAGSRARLVVHAYGMRAGRVERQRRVVTCTGREIEVETDGGSGFNVDGELIEVGRARLTVQPRAFEVVVG